MVIARARAPLRGRHLTRGTTEAGRIPLCTQVENHRCLGLNDEWVVAHHGAITKARWPFSTPDLILFYAANVEPLSATGMGPDDDDAGRSYAEERGDAAHLVAPVLRTAGVLYAGATIPSQLLAHLRSLKLMV